MTEPISFCLAALLLLMTPGPTNALLAASGASAGFARSLKLVPAELGGYMTAISLFSFCFGEAIGAAPAAAVLIKGAAALWLAASAVALWRKARPSQPASAPAGFLRVFVTTLLNPKALIFAFVILPPFAPAALAPWLAALGALIALAGLSWIGLGVLLARSGGGWATPRRVTRVAAVVLGCFAGALASSAVVGVLALVA